MKKQPLMRNLILVFLPLLAVALAAQAQEQPNPDGLIIVGPGQRYTETIPVIDIHDLGYQPAALPTNDPVNHSPFTIQTSPLTRGGGSDPNNPYAVIRKTGPAFMQPGGSARYEITLNNYESITRTVQLVDPLPPGLAYVPDSANGLAYDASTRTLHWQGELAPGNLDYIIEEHSPALPYLDLAAFGAVNLCDDFIANEEVCDDVTVTFNLGVNGYTTNLYGELLSQLTVSANGLILAPETAVSGPYAHNQWLPDAATPGFVLAGLWRDVDMGGSDALPNGRFHAAIISGLIAGHDVFYAQWHDAPQSGDPDLTARHAIALLLNGDSNLAGDAFFIYDNISNPAQLVAQGYTIGVADKLGARGVTYAYAPCCGAGQPPQGYPPAAGTTLHLRPVLFGAESDYSRTFSYEAVVNVPVPETIASTAVVTSSSPDPALATAWSTHYLYVRWQTYLPLAIGRDE
ncbi:hypothetical protein [Candidatus Leptofilum sp.]|uniref:hypothetical protein n=1 Tax=Candidatus Leptofilum sp. TaxID=3241576 RepID=UPI003B59DC1C